MSRRISFFFYGFFVFSLLALYFERGRVVGCGFGGIRGKGGKGKDGKGDRGQIGRADEVAIGATREPTS